MTAARRPRPRVPHVHIVRDTPPPYATVIHAPVARTTDTTRLLVAAREGDVVVHTPLATTAPDYEGARIEATAMYPDRLIVVPSLGEAVPS